jgi:hypothetical protein
VCNERLSTLREVLDELRGRKVLDPFVTRLHSHFELSGALGETTAGIQLGNPHRPEVKETPDA